MGLTEKLMIIVEVDLNFFLSLILYVFDMNEHTLAKEGS